MAQETSRWTLGTELHCMRTEGLIAALPPWQRPREGWQRGCWTSAVGPLLAALGQARRMR